MFTMIFSVTVMICCVLVHGESSEELSKIALDFASVRNGNFDNQKQIAEGDTDNDFIRAWIVPVRVPIFGLKPVLLLFEELKEKIIRVQLHVVTGTEADVVKITKYNITDPSLYKPDNIPVDDLANLTLDKLQTDPDSVITFVRIGPGIFTGDWPISSVIIDGKHPVYAITCKCDEVLGISPIGATERQGHNIYELIRKGDKYKLINAPDNYVGPCDTKQ